MASIIKKLLQTDEAPVVEKKKTTAAKASTTPSVQSAAGPDLRRVLKRPLVTEKSVAAGAMQTYVFAALPSANKITIARAVQAAYGIKPISVRTLPIRSRGRVRGRISGRTSAFKKAIVTLPKGKTITVVEGV